MKKLKLADALSLRGGDVEPIYGWPIGVDARRERRPGDPCGPDGTFFERRRSFWQRLIARFRRENRDQPPPQRML